MFPPGQKSATPEDSEAAVRQSAAQASASEGDTVGAPGDLNDKNLSKESNTLNEIGTDSNPLPQSKLNSFSEKLDEKTEIAHLLLAEEKAFAFEFWTLLDAVFKKTFF